MRIINAFDNIFHQKNVSIGFKNYINELEYFIFFGKTKKS